MKMLKKGNGVCVELYVKSDQRNKLTNVLKRINKLKEKKIIQSESEFLIDMLLSQYNEMDMEGLIPDTQSTFDNFNKLGKGQSKITEYTKIPRMHEFLTHGICGVKTMKELYVYHLEEIGGLENFRRIIMGAQRIAREIKYDDFLNDLIVEASTVEKTSR